MDIESAYEQMWAADVAAMSDYHADASAAVEHLPPWQEVVHNRGFHFGHGQLAPGLSDAAPPTGHTLSSFGLTPGDGILNSPILQTGAASHASPDLGILTAGQHVTGGMSHANFGSGGLLNSDIPGTGLRPSLGHPDLLHPASP